MKTEELAAMLAKGSAATDVGSPALPQSIRARYGVAIAGGVLCAIVIMATVLGVRHDLAQAVHQPAFLLKIAYVAALAAAGVFASLRVVRPGADLRWVWVALAAPVVVMWAVALMELSSATVQERSTLFFGATWRTCPWLIAMLSVPLLAAIIWAMAGLAPTNLSLAGGVAGFASGALATVVYSAHCPEIAAPFIGFWYLVGIAVPTAIGWIIGPRFLRW